MRFDLLCDHAAELGVVVDWADLGAHRRGEYRDDERRIILHRGLTRPQAIATLAHELGHAAYRDRCSTARTEARAWEYGARVAIDELDYSRAERLVGNHPNAIAAELGVTRRLVEAWQEWYSRSRIQKTADA